VPRNRYSLRRWVQRFKNDVTAALVNFPVTPAPTAAID